MQAICIVSRAAIIACQSRIPYRHLRRLSHCRTAQWQHAIPRGSVSAPIPYQAYAWTHITGAGANDAPAGRSTATAVPPDMWTAAACAMATRTAQESILPSSTLLPSFPNLATTHPIRTQTTVRHLVATRTLKRTVSLSTKLLAYTEPSRASTQQQSRGPNSLESLIGTTATGLEIPLTVGGTTGDTSANL